MPVATVAVVIGLVILVAVGLRLMTRATKDKRQVLAQLDGDITTVAFDISGGDGGIATRHGRLQAGRGGRWVTVVDAQVASDEPHPVHVHLGDIRWIRDSQDRLYGPW